MDSDKEVIKAEAEQKYREMIAIEKQNYEIKAKYQSDLNITLSKQV